MDDLLGLNEINTITHCNLNCYFEEEDKKEELYIKMIEDRIMFKIRQEIIVPLISDFNVKSDINMCEILKLKDDVSELKECVEREKNKNIELTDIIDRLIYNNGLIKQKQNEIKEDLTIIHNGIDVIGTFIEDNVSQIDILREQFINIENIINDNNRQTDKLSNIISKLYVPNNGTTTVFDSYRIDMDRPVFDNYHYIATKKIMFRDYSKCYQGCYDLTLFYNLETLHLTEVPYVDFQNLLLNNDLTILILERGGYRIYDTGSGKKEFTILNLNCLPSLKVIEFKNIHTMDIDGFIEQLSSYKHNIKNLIFTECDFYRYCNNQKQKDKLNAYCEENNITIKSN